MGIYDAADSSGDVEMIDLTIPGNKRVVREAITYRQNRKGKPLKISREKYLRSDLNCGSFGCSKCPMNDKSRYKLDDNPVIYSELFKFKHYLLPDTGFLLRQVDVLDDLHNVILLQNVMEELWRKHVTKYKRVRDGMKLKKWMYFPNEHHCDTFVSRSPDETMDERNIRAFMHCYHYFENHFKTRGIRVVILSDDPDFKKKAKIQESDGVLVATSDEYVLKMTEDFKHLEDKLCKIPYNEDEIIHKYSTGDFEYPSHLDPSIVQNGIKTGKYFQGSYRTINFYEGKVRISDGSEEPTPKKRKDPDEINPNEILLQGLENINRSSEGDIVAIEILPEDKWSAPSGIVILDPPEQEPPITDEKVVVENETADPDAREEEYRLEEEEIMEAAIKSKSSLQQKQRTGRVVGIIRRKWQPCCGVVQKSLKQGSQFHMFLPDNKKLPRVRIETRNVDRFDGKKIVVQIDQWPVTSRFPIGHYIKILGDAGTVETETEAILHEHGIPHGPFSKAVEACLPKLPYTIEPAEYSKRTDFRNTLICSVDPPGCTDIDDALHCTKLDDNTFEVGVHIADVSHYVKPETALDDEAAKRSTSVYLADRRIDMIPTTLSSNIASLHCNTDKLVFSVVWKLDKSAEILDTKFYKAIINSKAAMTYAEAQARLNSKTATDDISMSLKHLSYLAQIIRQKRLENGALILSGGEVHEDETQIDEEESHAMVEEFMLLANCSVAKFVLETFREYALLRRHPTPPPANFEPLLLAAKAHSLKIVVDKGSKALNDSLERQPPELKKILRVLTTRCMTQALYCCSGTTPPDEFHHFGLAADIYTHFTSPIRRYADLVVHRLLAIALDFEKPNQRILNSQGIHTACETINIRHRMAQYASRASNNFHRCKNLKGKKEVHEGYVMFVRRNALQIYVPNYGMEGYIFFPKDNSYEYNEKDGEVKFGSVVFRPLDPVTIGLSLEEKKDKVAFKLLKPNVPGLSEAD